MTGTGVSERLTAILRRLDEALTRDRGATATEYAILVAFIAIVIVAGISAFGTQLNGWFSNMAAQLP